MVSLGEEEFCDDGTVVVRQDEMNPDVRMVITGQLYIVRDNVQYYTVVNQVYMLVFNWKVMIGVLVILWRDGKEKSDDDDDDDNDDVVDDGDDDDDDDDGDGADD